MNISPTLARPTITTASATRAPGALTRLAWSTLAAQSAEQVALAAAPIVAVLALGADAAATGWLQAAQTLPFLLLAIPAGVLVDRASRRGLMASAEALRALSLAAVLALASAGWLSVLVLGLLGFVAAWGTVAYSVAAPALVPALVAPGTLVTANARLELARTTAFVLGPALAGVLAGWADAAPAFAVSVALSACAAAMLARLPEPPRPLRARRRVVHELREGAAFVLGHPLLRPVLVTKTLFGAAFFVLQAVFVHHAVHALGLTARGVGATLALYGAGMVAAALVAPALVRALPFGVVIAAGPVAGLIAGISMAATIWVPSALLAAAAYVLVGAGPVVWIVSTNTLRQTVTPAHLLGRVAALDIAAQGARPIGAAAGAAVASLHGTEACLLLSAVGFLVQAAVIVASPAARLRRQPEPPG